jgi:hypothetical protein
MTAQVIIYPQATNSMYRATPSANMSQRDRQQHPYSNGAYSWPTHMSYTSLPEHSMPYDDPSYSGMYGRAHATETGQYSAANYSHDLPGAVGGGSAGLPWADIPLDPNAIYHVRFLFHAESIFNHAHCYTSRCQSMARVGRGP